MIQPKRDWVSTIAIPNRTMHAAMATPRRRSGRRTTVTTASRTMTVMFRNRAAMFGSQNVAFARPSVPKTPSRQRYASAKSSAIPRIDT